MVTNSAPVRAALGLEGSGLWFGIQPVSAGIFGALAGFAVTLLLSLLTRAGRQEVADAEKRL
jgi:cation/acetate symporter